MNSPILTVIHQIQCEIEQETIETVYSSYDEIDLPQMLNHKARRVYLDLPISISLFIVFEKSA